MENKKFDLHKVEDLKLLIEVQLKFIEIKRAAVEDSLKQPFGSLIMQEFKDLERAMRQLKHTIKTYSEKIK